MADKATKKLTVLVDQAASVKDVAQRLQVLGMKEIKPLEHIFCITGEWDGASEEIKQVDGVEGVEEQTTDYFPS